MELDATQCPFIVTSSPDRIGFPGAASKRPLEGQPPLHPLIAAETDEAQAITVTDRLRVW